MEIRISTKIRRNRIVPPLRSMHWVQLLKKHIKCREIGKDKYANTEFCHNLGKKYEKTYTQIHGLKYTFTNTKTQYCLILQTASSFDLDVLLVATVQKVEAVWEMCEGHIVKIYEGFQWQQCGSSHKVSDIGSGGFCFAVFSPHARPGWSHYNIIVPSHGSYSLQSNLLYIKILCWKFQNQQKFFSTIRCSIPHLEHYLTHPEIHPSHTQFLLSRRWAYRSDLSSLKREDDLILCQQISYEKAGWYNLCPAVKSINQSITQSGRPESEGVRLPSVQSVTILNILNDSNTDTFFRYQIFSIPIPILFHMGDRAPTARTAKRYFKAIPAQLGLGRTETNYNSAKDRNPESNWWRSHVEARGAGAPCERLL